MVDAGQLELFTDFMIVSWEYYIIFPFSTDFMIVSWEYYIIFLFSTDFVVQMIATVQFLNARIMCLSYWGKDWVLDLIFHPSVIYSILRLDV